MERAKTGDLLLFTGRQLGCKVQRLITGSRFGILSENNLDHIGMLLKWQSGEVKFIEAASNVGVSIYSMNQFIKESDQKFYDKIVYRPLYYKRTRENTLKLEDFLKKVIKKKYTLNPLRLLQKYSDYNSVENVANKSGYFCSELVGSIYKLLGFLPKNISSSQYFPGTFSEETKLTLENGSVLGHEYLIEFENKEDL